MPEEIKTEVQDEVNSHDDPNYDFLNDDDNDAEWDNVKWGSDDEDEAFGDEESENGDSDEADQPEAGNPEEKPAEAEEGKPEANDQDADQWLELKHMDDPVRKVSKKEAQELAQKGLDYDRIRQERDQLKQNSSRYEEMENFLKEMQGDFASIEDFMDDTRARIKAEDEGISFDDALKTVRANRTSKAPAAEPADKPSPVDEFVRRFPHVKAEEIPESVWAEVRETGDLVGAYVKYANTEKESEIQKLKDEIETLKQNAKNAARSAGSSRSSGNKSGKSAIAELWDNGE